MVRLQGDENLPLSREEASPPKPARPRKKADKNRGALDFLSAGSSEDAELGLTSSAGLRCAERMIGTKTADGLNLCL